MSAPLQSLKQFTQSFADSQRAKLATRYFKTGKGEYGEGDMFLGLTTPNINEVVNQFWEKLSLDDLAELIKERYHEYRSIALSILKKQYVQTKKNIQKKKKSLPTKAFYDFYLKHTKWINNWDLVDISAPHILGDYLHDKLIDRKILYQLAKSKDLWQKRIGMMATMTFIKNNDFEDALAIAKILKNDSHDLIHKAVGWMLREIGKKNQAVEETFLKKHYQTMPRTMLRYAIEKFDQTKRAFYMKK